MRRPNLALNFDRKNVTSSVTSAARSRSGGTERNHVQAEEQIRPEPSAADLFGEIAIGCGDDAHVHANRLAAADRLELLFLEHAQELDLGLERQLADLVEEQRSAVGDLEPADPADRWRR